MKSTLVILRHGIAESGAGKNDGERQLTDEGRFQLLRVARGLAQRGVRPTRIVTSPLVRTRETADLLRRELVGPSVEPWPELAAGAHPESMASVLGDMSAGATVILVGHMPDVSALLAYFANGAAVSFVPAAAACVDFIGAAVRGEGVLRWYLTPEQLAVP